MANSIDDQAAKLAGQILAKSNSGYGDMPENRKEAEGGFVDEAGGTFMDAQKGKRAMKSQMKSGEPGRQGFDPLTGEDMTSEPERQAAMNRAARDDLDTDADDMARRRKKGQVGVGGGLQARQNLSEREDEYLRGRKEGQVGIHKSDDDDEDDMAPMKKWRKSDDDDEDDMPPMKKCGFKKGDDDDEDDKEEDEEEETEKSMINVRDLMKSLNRLEQVADGYLLPASKNRRSFLASKFMDDSLNKSELDEIYDLIKGENMPSSSDEEDEEDEEENAPENMNKSFQDYFSEDPVLSEGYDVSAFLERQSQLLAAGLDQINSDLSKSISSQNENARAFNSELAKSLRGMAQLSKNQSKLIKSLTQRLEAVENQPMPRRGYSSVNALSKSMAGEVGYREMGPNQILSSLENMALRMDYAPCGERLTQAVAQFETSGKMSPSLMTDIINFNRNGR